VRTPLLASTVNTAAAARGHINMMRLVGGKPAAVRPTHLPDEVNIYIYICVCMCINVVSDVSGVDEGEMNISGTIENQFTLPRLGRKCGTVRRNAKNAVKRKKTKII